MTKPTREEVQAEISKLKELAPVIRQVTMFGDDNRAAIEAGIVVLVRNLTEDQIWDRFTVSHTRDSALCAWDWVNGGEMDGSPSTNWEPLRR